MHRALSRLRALAATCYFSLMRPHVLTPLFAAASTLPGVGPVMAKNILAWRETNGRFATVEQLQEISGIGPSRFAQLAPLVTVG